MDGYSLIPLEEPVFSYEEVVVASTVFNNWLNENYGNLNTHTMKGPREHLYYLITSYVYHLQKKDGVVLPDEHDPILETLFSWSEKLGVYGSHKFYNKLKSDNSVKMPELMNVVDGIEISAKDDMYNVHSTSGDWSFKIPYYFMIWDINEFNATNGMRTQLVSISTGASKDNTPAGRS